MSSPPYKFTFSPPLSPLTLQTPQTLSSKSVPSIAHLMTSVLVLRQQKQAPSPAQILLLRRCPADSYALKWEAPGGSADPTDRSILSAAARELFEESALGESHFHAVLGMTKQKAEELFSSASSASEEKRPDNWGIDPEDEQAEDIEVQVSDDMKILFTTFHEPDGIWGKVNFLATVAEDAKVEIDLEEHVEWGWFTEEEVRTGRALRSSVITETIFPDEELSDGGKRVMEFTSQAVWGSLLEAFSVGRELGVIV
ncbi:hypothetical protein TASIC1_0011026400 [Trichoderma asperellum]|uniref:Nudix hydrolase domain-containing protein n=1 Tax=Trichoderma asperellum TaxID=101201 RepID=A0A6V8R1K2_TRIAP|nr:hypothetical protein LI328DRAFT_135464 [Trichoderma asperelloides]GFP58897.1 hypothetical protein TASIC1_0011026400 [Trichoderma asperellum]